MLGVSTQPQLNVTGFGGFGSPSSSKFPSVPNGPPNGVPTNNSIDNEIAELKANAKEQARTLLKSKSAQQSIRAAKTMYSYGKEQEKTNDAKAALAAFIKMHQIMKNVLDTAQVIEFRDAMKSWPTYAQASHPSCVIVTFLILTSRIRRSLRRVWRLLKARYDDQQKETGETSEPGAAGEETHLDGGD